MKFRCERDVLVDALQTAGRAVAGPRTALPVLSGIRVEVAGDDLLLAGTDLDLAIQARATVAGVSDGVTVVPARLVVEIVRALEPGAVSVETDDEELRITAGRSQFAVRTLVAGEFPRLAEPTGEDVKKGFEAIKDVNLGGLVPPLQITPTEHEGGGWVQIFQVKGGKFVKETEWIQSYHDVVQAAVKAAE